MTATPINANGLDRVSALRTAAAVQRPINVSFAGQGRPADSASITSLSTLFERLGASRPAGVGFANFDAEAARTDQAISAALNTRLGGGGFEVTSQSEAISEFSAKGLQLNGSTGFAFEIRQSAQQGTLYLSLGLMSRNGTPGALDLSGGDQLNSAFSIQIAGSVGGRQLSFSSGTSLQQIANAINSVTGATGVEAVVNSSSTAGGVLLRSTEFGSREFVSVEVALGDGSLVGPGGGTSTLGVYGMKADDASVSTGIDRNNFTSIDSGQEVRDLGQDVVVFSQAAEVIGRGQNVIANFGATLGGFMQFRLDNTDTVGDADLQTLGQVSVRLNPIFSRDSATGGAGSGPTPAGVIRPGLNISG